ncbi:MAG: hypothetical protein WC628_04725 [Candidatus Omnitrophota bacterium]
MPKRKKKFSIAPPKRIDKFNINGNNNYQMVSIVSEEGGRIVIRQAA